MTPAELIDQIDQKYLDAKDKKISRFSVEWGGWSREMNLQLRQRTEDSTLESAGLKNVFVYWTVVSQILELQKKSSLLKRGRLRKLERQRAAIRKAVMTDNPIRFTEKELLRKALAK